MKTIDNKYISKYSRDRHLKRAYGIDSIIFNALADKQNWCCAICSDDSKKLVVDHCHKTNIIRGLLCTPCNQMIGNAKESSRTLFEGIRYIEKHLANAKAYSSASDSGNEFHV